MLNQTFDTVKLEKMVTPKMKRCATVHNKYIIHLVWYYIFIYCSYSNITFHIMVTCVYSFQTG